MTLEVALVDQVLEIRFGEPDRRNPLGFDSLAAIAAAVRGAEAEGARAILLLSSGPVFSAGADLRQLTGTSADVAIDDAIAAATLALRNCPLPVVAAVQGPCLGGAVDLVVSADIVLAVPESRFEVPAVRLGILYSPAALAVMRSRVSSGLLRTLMFGVSVSAADALAGGLVARLVAADELETVARAVAVRSAAGVPGAVSATKRLLAHLDAGGEADEHWDSERRALLDSPERLDAIRRRTTDPR